MVRWQRTIREAVSCSGVGLHTGNITMVVFKPAPVNTGRRFIRTDIPGQPEIPADIDYVVDVSRETAIGVDGAIVHTVEHLLAALVGFQIDNVSIEINSDEPPAGDGSAQIFVDCLRRAGYIEQDSPRDYLAVDDVINYVDERNQIELVVLPSDDLKITFLIDYQTTALGTQYTSMHSLEKEFIDGYAPARTFCLLSDVEKLREQGLIKGGNLDNAVVVVDRRVDQHELEGLRQMFGLNEPIYVGENGIINGVSLRYPNEFCRHKVLDLLGDLSLLGAPIKGHVLAARSGHAANIQLVSKVRKIYQDRHSPATYYRREMKKDKVSFGIETIKKILPHRYPFLLVDRIVDLIPGERVTGLKNVTINEEFFKGHFPQKSVMPAVLIIEAMAQVGAVLMLDEVEHPEEKIPYFVGIDKAKFRKPVVPGDQISFELEMVRRRSNSCRMFGRAYVDGDLVAEAELMAVIVDRDEA
ncbi:MAG: bifunctional UDP-3-O-[3-hydroxymyristoyl] N-acetylglucosamine deacetylase/3-hydroxyacyl-ACP dehydratase [Candidatus Latescibacteria bacterium]|nr:bifunctional UDP-3-O-[3-hydroxymyristoyl] N-acetylglucosamine deacetylase/3-hydroxyacyl-ACP dehydratase [Candidatus Latescibacterota bacterium]